MDPFFLRGSARVICDQGTEHPILFRQRSTLVLRSRTWDDAHDSLPCPYSRVAFQQDSKKKIVTNIFYPSLVWLSCETIVDLRFLQWIPSICSSVFLSKKHDERRDENLDIVVIVWRGLIFEAWFFSRIFGTLNEFINILLYNGEGISHSDRGRIEFWIILPLVVIQLWYL